MTTPRLRALQPVPPWASPASSTTAGSCPGATSRTPPTASRCAPSAAWCPSCTPPAAAARRGVVRRQNGDTLMPCGRCRQLLWENGTPDTLLQTPEGVLPMSAILPQAFGPDDLDDLDAVAAVD